jgi:hypothetical protein
MRVTAVASEEIALIEVIRMRVSYKKVFDTVTANAVRDKMVVGVGWEIDQQIVVYERLRAGADILAPELSCLIAVFTVAKYSGKSFSRRSSEIFKFHIMFSFRNI